MPAKKKKVLQGFCFLYAEHSEEMAFWAFQDSQYIKHRGRKNESWSGDGWYMLKNGDKLTIFCRKKKKKVLWSGIIDLKNLPSFSDMVDKSQPSLYERRKTWFDFFLNEHPAKLVLGPNH